MELAYADVFDVKRFVLLHHLEYRELKAREHGVPPLLLASQGNSALKWKVIIDRVLTTSNRYSVNGISTENLR
jgi:hypothetical protein